MRELADHEPRWARCREALHRSAKPRPLECGSVRLVVADELRERPAATRARTPDGAGVARKLSALAAAADVADRRQPLRTCGYGFAAIRSPVRSAWRALRSGTVRSGRGGGRARTNRPPPTRRTVCSGRTG